MKDGPTDKIEVTDRGAASPPADNDLKAPGMIRVGNRVTKYADYFMFPPGDQNGWFWAERQMLFATRLSEHKLLRDHHTVIQAGGNVGIFPVVFSHFFKHVITFEPDRENWACLLHNTQKRTNIQCSPYALGNKRGEAFDIAHNRVNCGASYLAPPANKAAAATNTARLDDFNLQQLDLLQLDVEGFELFALQGAEVQVLTHRPAICVELNGLASRYGSSDEAVIKWLHEHGYQAEHEFVAPGASRDYLFIHPEGPTGAR